MWTICAVVVASLATLAKASALPRHDLAPRAPPSMDLVSVNDRRDGAIERRDLNHTYDIGWQAQDLPLFSAQWALGAGTQAGAVAVSASETVSLSLECLDCRTWGAIEVEIEDELQIDQEQLVLAADMIFNNVGAYFDFAAAVSSQTTGSIGLGVFKSGSPHVSGIFTANVDLGIDLFVHLDDKVEIDGGFQLAIPNGAKASLNITINHNETATAEIHGMPHLDFELLPISMSDASVNVTIGLRLRADAGIQASFGDASVSVGAGAYLILTELTAGAARSSKRSCKKAVFAEIDGNAGAYATAGAALDGLATQVGPAVSTTFYSLGTTVCLDTHKPTFHKTLEAPQTTAAASACPAALLTATTSVTAVYSLTSCVVAAANCPASLTQMVVVTNVESVTTAFCPTTATGAGATAHTATVTTGAESTPAATVPAATIMSPVAFTQLSDPITSSLDAGTATPPANATITGEFLAITVTASADDRESDAVQGLASTGSFFGLMATLLAAVILV